MRLFVLIALAASPLVGSATPAVSAPLSEAQRYVVCIAQKHPAMVRELLQAADRSAADRPYRALSDDSRCFAAVFGDQAYNPEDAAFPIDVLRGKLAEQSLLASAAQVAALSALPLQQKRYIRPWFAATGRDPSVDEMGACIDDTDPSNVMNLVGTIPGTAEENQAIAALSPALGKCLSAGTRLQASRAALRAALAEALYQRVTNPALSTVETPK